MNTAASVPATAPMRIAADTWLIPNLAPGGDGVFLPANSMIIRGREPVIVDTGAPVHRTQWLEKAFAVVEPEDVRWVFLSHDDGDHTGALLDVLERCPKATLVTNFFSVERLGLEKPGLPLHRMRWLEPGDRLDAGDRTLHLFRPPIFDGPTTRGLYDPKSGAMWIVDTFAALTPGTLDAELAARGFAAEDDTRVMVRPSIVALALPPLPPHLQWRPLDAAAFAETVGTLRGSPPEHRRVHAERLARSPVPYRAFALADAATGAVLCCGQVAREGALVGVYDVFTAPQARGQRLAGLLCERMLSLSAREGAEVAYLQVDAVNAAARAVYGRLGFADVYAYHYRVAPAGAR